MHAWGQMRGESHAAGAKLTAWRGKNCPRAILIATELWLALRHIQDRANGVHLPEARNYLLTGFARSLLYCSTSEGA